MTTQLRQCEAIPVIWEVAEHDKEMFVHIYAELDADGYIARASNVHPLSSREYAVIMYHTARKRKWIS